MEAPVALVVFLRTGFFPGVVFFTGVFLAPVFLAPVFLVEALLPSDALPDCLRPLVVPPVVGLVFADSARRREVVAFFPDFEGDVPAAFEPRGFEGLVAEGDFPLALVEVLNPVDVRFLLAPFTGLVLGCFRDVEADLPVAVGDGRFGLPVFRFPDADGLSAEREVAVPLRLVLDFPAADWDVDAFFPLPRAFGVAALRVLGAEVD